MNATKRNVRCCICKTIAPPEIVKHLVKHKQDLICPAGHRTTYRNMLRQLIPTEIRGTHASTVLEHLHTKGPITSIEAIELYGNTRLAASIHTLRSLGHAIKTNMITVKNRLGRITKVAKYTLT